MILRLAVWAHWFVTSTTCVDVGNPQVAQAHSLDQKQREHQGLRGEEKSSA